MLLSMKEISLAASDFKARCLRLLDEVSEHGTTLIITKRGRPVARLTPVEPESKPLGGRWEGKVKIKGDIVHFDTSEEWEALQ